MDAGAEHNFHADVTAFPDGDLSGRIEENAVVDGAVLADAYLGPTEPAFGRHSYPSLDVQPKLPQQTLPHATR
jgi:hypothetical protein